jgi:aryl-alcohol dehydrogenase-like predicted oxidoreductase
MTSIPFGKVVHFLRTGQVSYEDQPLVVALAMDAKWGSMREEKWRPHPSEYPDQRAATELAIMRLIKLPSEAPIIVNSSPLFKRWGVGWGSYKWRYNPEIPKMAVQNKAALIDTAPTYGYGKVEKELGKAIRQYGETLLATKIASNHMSAKNATNSFHRSVENLGRVPDLIQTHWPSRDIPIDQTLRALMAIPEVKSIGVSNMSVDQIWSAQRVYPMLASVQVKLYREEWWWNALIPFTRASGLTLIAHSPFGQGNTVDRSILPYCRDNGIIPIPGTNNPLHLTENLKWS